MEGLKLGLCDNCTLRDAWLPPRLSCRGQAADALRGDDTHAGAAPPAQTPEHGNAHPHKAEGTRMGGRGNGYPTYFWRS